MIQEETGKMIKMKGPCIILEGVICRSDFHRLCPRAIYPFWRENWLKRAANVPAPRSRSSNQPGESSLCSADDDQLPAPGATLCVLALRNTN
jgi:hypothetical protein